MNEIEWEYTIDPNANIPIMLLNDTIGEKDGEGISGAEFQRELMYLDTLGKEKIEIWINSCGGSVIDGFSICSAILNAKTPICTYNVGICGSIAAVIYMCAKTRYMADYALMMVHNVAGGTSGYVREELNNSISLMLSRNSTLSQDQVKMLMVNETWMNYDMCIERGFCNKMEQEIIQNSTGVVFTNENAYEDIMDYANNIINELNMKKNTPEEVAIEATPEAVEVEITETVEEVENTVDTEVVEEAIEEEVIELTNSVDEKDVLIAQLKNEIASMKNAEVDREINAFINEHVEIGKITNETRESWFNLCKSDFDNTKEVIKSLSINREAPKLENNANNKTPKSFLEMINFGKNK